MFGYILSRLEKIIDISENDLIIMSHEEFKKIKIFLGSDKEIEGSLKNLEKNDKEETFFIIKKESWSKAKKKINLTLIK